MAALVQAPTSQNIAVYNSQTVTETDQQVALLQLDVDGNTKVTQATKLAGEDLTNDLIKVEERFSSASYSTAQTATTIKSGAGFLHTVTILGGAAGAITVWDNVSGSGTTILPAFTPGNVTVPVTLTINAIFSTGLTFTTAAATVIEFSYR